jgi:hypothetical protein
LLTAARGQLVDVPAQLLRRHAGAGVGHRQLAHSSSRSVESLPVEVPHDPPAGAATERGDRVEPVDGQLAEALKVRALAAEALEHYLGHLVVFSLWVEGLLLATCRWRRQ